MTIFEEHLDMAIRLKQAFTQLDLGAGSAIGVIWMMLLGAAIAIYNMKTKRFDEL